MSTIAIRAARDVSPENVILGLLYQQPAHGYDLRRRLNQDLGQVWHLPLNQIYNTLNRLEARGLVSSSAEPSLSGPSRRRFQLNEPGRQQFRVWLHSVTPCNIRAIRVEFTSRLYFAVDISQDLARTLLDEQLNALLAFQSQLQARLAALAPEFTPNRMALMLRVQTMAALLDWMREYQAALAPPPAEG